MELLGRCEYFQIRLHCSCSHLTVTTQVFSRSPKAVWNEVGMVSGKQISGSEQTEKLTEGRSPCDGRWGWELQQGRGVCCWREQVDVATRLIF